MSPVKKAYRSPISQFIKLAISLWKIADLFAMQIHVAMILKKDFKMGPQD